MIKPRSAKSNQLELNQHLKPDDTMFIVHNVYCNQILKSKVEFEIINDLNQKHKATITAPKRETKIST